MRNEELAILAQQGDKNAMFDLWEATRRLIYKLLQPYHTVCPRYGMVIEDLQQEGYFAFVRAVKAYKPEKGILFTSYLNYSVQNVAHEALGGRGKKTPDPFPASLDEPIKGIEDESISLGDTIPDESAAAEFEQVQDDWQREQLAATMRECLGELPENRRNILYARYYEQKSLRETGQAQGCTPEAVRQQEYHALRALRHPRHAGRLKPYYDAMDFISTKAYSGNSFSAFKRRTCSQPEWMVEILERIQAREANTINQMEA